MRHLRVGGVWLRSIGASTDLTLVHSWPHGSEEATWRMQPGTFHPVLAQGGALVEGYCGGVRMWRGHLGEPATDGQFAAHGSWAEASGVYALDGAGDATNVPDTAIDAAIARGAVSWTRPTSLSAASWGTASDPMKLTDLLEQAMAGLGKRWWVDPDGAVRAAADPTEPTFVVPHAVVGRGLSLAEDTYYSHLIGKYLAAGPVYASETVGDAVAAARFGYKEQRVDLTPMGIISGATATAELNARLALSGARMGYAEGLELGPGQLTTSGGTSVTLTDATAGQMVRLMGVTDRTHPTGDRPVTDIVVARSSCTDTTLQLTPIGKADRNLQEVIAA